MSISAKFKRKRRGSESDFSESEGISLPKVENADDEESKRRSGRNQGSRKKYVDELELNLSEEEEMAKNQDPSLDEDGEGMGGGGGAGGGGGIKPNFIFLVSVLVHFVCFQAN